MQQALALKSLYFDHCKCNGRSKADPGEGSPSDPIQVIALKMYLCPSKVALHSPEGTCHILMVLSHDPDTRVLLSLGWNATEDTRLLP